MFDYYHHDDAAYDASYHSTSPKSESCGDFEQLSQRLNHAILRTYEMSTVLLFDKRRHSGSWDPFFVFLSKNFLARSSVSHC